MLPRTFTSTTSKRLIQLSSRRRYGVTATSNPSTTGEGFLRPSHHRHHLVQQRQQKRLTSPPPNTSHQQLQCRTFARTSESEPDSPELKAKNFVMQVGYDPKVAQGIVEALKESGVSGTGLLSTVRAMAGRWEVDEDAGLEALAEAVILDLARKEGRKAITLYVIPGNAWKASGEDNQDDFTDIVETPEEREESLSRAFKVEAMTGLTLTDVAKFGDGEGAETLGNCIECACSGIMACSTCHVVVDPEWYDKVGNPCDAEQDMLDLAYAPRKTSRLGCQIELDETMDGMVLRLPRGANNLMDHVPFG